LEATRRTLSRYIRKKERLWIRIFPHYAVTQRPNDIRMGKGKGKVEFWTTRLQAGQVLLEVGRIKKSKALHILHKASRKLPVQTTIIQRQIHKHD